MSVPLHKNLTLQQLEALVHLVEERNFSRAARKMNLTQPSLTKHIKNMEDILGTLVVNRESSGVTVTAEGRALYDCTRRIFRLLAETEEKIGSLSENEGGSITIAASTIPATYILPRVIRAFLKDHERVRCLVRTEDSDAVIDMVLDDEAEIGFIGKKPRNRKLTAEPLWEDRLVLAVPAGHRLVGRKLVAWSDIAGEPFIIREQGSATRAILENYLEERAGFGVDKLSVVCELGSSEAVKEAILAGTGLSVISIHAVSREIRSGMLCEAALEGLPLERNIYLIYKRQFSPKRHHRLFLDFVRSAPVCDTQ